MEESTGSTPPNSGPPMPAGKPETAISTVPPTLFRAMRASSMTARIWVSASGRITGKYSRERRSNSELGISTSGKASSKLLPTESTCPPICTPRCSRIWRHTAPAAQRQAVSRARRNARPRGHHCARHSAKRRCSRRARGEGQGQGWHSPVNGCSCFQSVCRAVRRWYDYPARRWQSAAYRLLYEA